MMLKIQNQVIDFTCSMKTEHQLKQLEHDSSSCTQRCHVCVPHLFSHPVLLSTGTGAGPVEIRARSNGIPTTWCRKSFVTVLARLNSVGGALIPAWSLITAFLKNPSWRKKTFSCRDLRGAVKVLPWGTSQRTVPSRRWKLSSSRRDSQSWSWGTIALYILVVSQDPTHFIYLRNTLRTWTRLHSVR